MARDLDAIKITRKWSNSGITVAIPDVGTDSVISREKGFPSRYSDPTAMGKLIRSGEFNQLLKEITAICWEINSGKSVPELSLIHI